MLVFEGNVYDRYVCVYPCEQNQNRTGTKTDWTTEDIPPKKICDSLSGDNCEIVIPIEISKSKFMSHLSETKEIVKFELKVFVLLLRDIILA